MWARGYRFATPVIESTRQNERLAESAPRSAFETALASRRTARTSTGPLREWLDSHRWTETHRRLATQPLFHHCSRSEIRWIRRWGDEVAIEAGEVLLRERTTGAEFVIVLSGEVELTKRGRVVATVGAGEHVGDAAILGLRPQPATAITRTRCELFVIGRRYLVSLALDTAGFRHGLFPGLEREQAAARVRQMRDEGRAEYRRLNHAQSEEVAVSGPATTLVWSRSRREPASPFLPHAPRAASPPRRSPAVSARTRRIRRGIAALACVAPVAALSLAWHPPVLVVTPGEPIDVSREITIAGLAAPPVNGRFMLLSVHVEQPTLGPLVVDRARGFATMRPARDQAAARRAARSDFTVAQSTAAAAAAVAFRRDAGELRVSFAPHDLGGPSASLLYALAVSDLLDPLDLARGRTIAATGRVDRDGRVHSVGYVREKAKVARASGASLMFVPRGQHPGDVGVKVVEVATLQDAIAVLRGV